jgi:hypothetical protein
VAVSPKTESTPPEKASSTISLGPAAPHVKAKDREQDCLHLLDQPLDDYINDSYEQVRQMSFSENSPGTYKDLFDTLGSQASEAASTWSDGSQWVSLVEAGNGERQKGSIRYALTATAFARWHASQVQLLDHVGPKKAAKQVSARIHGPEPECDEAKRVWEQSRQSLAVHLTRGRKWSWLMIEFGAGILLKNALYVERIRTDRADNELD